MYYHYIIHALIIPRNRDHISNNMPYMDLRHIILIEYFLTVILVLLLVILYGFRHIILV